MTDESGGDDTEVLEFSGGRAPLRIYMADALVCIEGGATMRAAAAALAGQGVGALVVGTADDVRGVITERDVLKAVADGVDLDGVTVAERATTSLVSCPVTATVGEASMAMMEAYLRHLVVRDGDAVVGIVSARDLLGAYTA